MINHHVWQHTLNFFIFTIIRIILKNHWFYNNNFQNIFLEKNVCCNVIYIMRLFLYLHKSYNLTHLMNTFCSAHAITRLKVSIQMIGIYPRWTLHLSFYRDVGLVVVKDHVFCCFHDSSCSNVKYYLSTF